MKPRLPPEVIGQIPLLQQNGLNGYQIANRLRIGKTTAYRFGGSNLDGVLMWRFRNQPGK